jgi:hypothetical protein
MKQIYVLDNSKGEAFSSLLMNELNYHEVRFSNVKTTRNVDYNGILIYIPPVGSPKDDIVSILRDKRYIFGFRNKMVVFINEDDYKEGRSTLEIIFGSNTFSYYQSVNFNTLLATIIVEDCVWQLKRKRKFHNNIV